MRGAKTNRGGALLSPPTPRYCCCPLPHALQNLQQSALVPAWFRELCPSATYLQLVDTGLPKVPRPRPAPAPHHSLQTLVWEPLRSLHTSADPIRRHVRQQLAALPALTSLSARHLDWAARPALISGSVTRLELFSSVDQHRPPPLVHLPTQFPNLRELDGPKYLMVHDDNDFHALLRLPHLRTLKLVGLSLWDSHRGVPWPQHLDLHIYCTLVDSFALLPLDHIAKCTLDQGAIVPTRDAARAERVAAAFRRWGAFPTRREDGGVLLRFAGRDFAALLTSLPPFLKAAPPPRPATLDVSGATETLSREKVRQLAALLTPNVRTLRFTGGEFAPGAWPALLPSLPPSVTTLQLDCVLPSVEQLWSMCLGATRPVRVVIAGPGAEARVRRVLAVLQDGAQDCLVRLEAADKL